MILSEDRSEMTLERSAAISPEPPVAEVDSDTEDDPGRLLNVWLGELDSLKQVRVHYSTFTYSYMRAENTPAT